MRIAVLAAIAALGFAVMSSSAASAAPAYGTSIGSAATKMDLKQNVWWHGRRVVIVGGGCGWCCHHPRRC